MDEEGARARSPFFPSSADTNVRGIIPANFFMTSETCGRCHKDIYDQWNSSAHHFSSFNNQWYRKSIEYMQDVVGTQAVEVVRRLPRPRGVLQRPLRPADQGADRHAGGAGRARLHVVPLDHARAAARWARATSTIEYPPLHDLAASENPVAAVRCTTGCSTSIPSRTASTFLKPFHREQTPEFCSSCHKVHLDVPVNAYRWFRGFNDYDNWQASGVSGEGARSFYYPPKPQKCADCHMPLVPSNDPGGEERQGAARIASPAANTALPFVNGDAEQLKAVQDFLRDGQISVDVFGLVRARRAPRRAGEAPAAAAEPRLASTFAVGEESMNFGAARAFLAAAGRGASRRSTRSTPSVRRGESVRVEVVVRTRKVGHFFPGGTVDAFDVWVELEAIDDRGRTLLPQRRASRTAARARSSPARTSIAACCSTSTATPSTSATPGRRARWPTCG